MILNSILTKLFGTTHERDIRRLMPKVETINALASSVEALDDGALSAKTVEF